MAGVRNTLLNMDWDISSLVTKHKGSEFVCAVQDYEGIPVVFTENEAFVVYNPDDTSFMNASDIITFIKKYARDNPEMYCEYMEFDDGYTGVLLMDSSGEAEEYNFKNLNLSHYEDDIRARIEDIAPYRVYTEIEMGDL